MPRRPIGAISFAKVYPMYVQKAEVKGRTKDEVDEVICWLTGFDTDGVEAQVAAGADFESFFAAAPALHPNRDQITGTICGYRVENIADPLEQQVRQLDKLVDELAKGRPLTKILRGAEV